MNHPQTKKAILRFAKYSATGIITFFFDLSLLFIFTDLLNIHYILSAIIAFIVALSINYQISKRYVFYGSLRSDLAGYIFFLLIGLVGIIIITISLYVFVDILHLHYITSRIIIASVVGIWNYLMNLYVNFRIAGK